MEKEQAFEVAMEMSFEHLLRQEDNKEKVVEYETEANLFCEDLAEIFEETRTELGSMEAISLLSTFNFYKNHEPWDSLDNVE